MHATIENQLRDLETANADDYKTALADAVENGLRDLDELRGLLARFGVEAKELREDVARMREAKQACESLDKAGRIRDTVPDLARAEAEADRALAEFLAEYRPRLEQLQREAVAAASAVRSAEGRADGLATPANATLGSMPRPDIPELQRRYTMEASRIGQSLAALDLERGRLGGRVDLETRLAEARRSLEFATFGDDRDRLEAEVHVAERRLAKLADLDEQEADHRARLNEVNRAANEVAARRWDWRTTPTTRELKRGGEWDAEQRRLGNYPGKGGGR